MFRSHLVRNGIRTVERASAAAVVRPAMPQRGFRVARPLLKVDNTGDETEHEGAFARTDGSVQYEHEEQKLPSSQPVQGRGGLHFKRTLASFSLEGRVGVVTGGARGLGLVMSQALVISGADIAIVDLNSKVSFCENI